MKKTKYETGNVNISIESFCLLLNSIDEKERKFNIQKGRLKYKFKHTTIWRDLCPIPINKPINFTNEEKESIFGLLDFAIKRWDWCIEHGWGDEDKMKLTKINLKSIKQKIKENPGENLEEFKKELAIFKEQVDTKVFEYIEQIKLYQERHKEDIQTIAHAKGKYESLKSAREEWRERLVEILKKIDQAKHKIFDFFIGDLNLINEEEKVLHIPLTVKIDDIWVCEHCMKEFDSEKSIILEKEEMSDELRSIILISEFSGEYESRTFCSEECKFFFLANRRTKLQHVISLFNHFMIKTFESENEKRIKCEYCSNSIETVYRDFPSEFFIHKFKLGMLKQFHQQERNYRKHNYTIPLAFCSDQCRTNWINLKIKQLKEMGVELSHWIHNYCFEEIHIIDAMQILFLENIGGDNK